MIDADKAEQVFRAWRDVTPPPFDEDSGRARFLESAAGVLARSRARPRRRTLVRAVVALAAVLACAAIWMIGRPSASLRFSTESGQGQLRAWLATDSTREMPLSFSEGTLLVIQPDSRGRVEQLSPNGASFLIERGAVRARVVHRSGTDWRFLAGPFEVEVTGTSLDVGWDPSSERLSVHVEEGAVVVRGPSLGPSQIVREGQRCVVDLPSRSVHTTAAPPPVSSPMTAAPVPEPPAPIVAPAMPAAPAPLAHPHVAPWTEFEARGDYDAAYAAATNAGLASLLRAASADDLLRLAQVGQLSGHPMTERNALLTCRRRFSGTEQAAVAAYKLGRSSSSSEAARWFETYLRERPAAPLSREALGRLIEARVEEGNEAAARSAATQYLAKYPDGPHAALARRVLGRARP